MPKAFRLTLDIVGDEVRVRSAVQVEKRISILPQDQIDSVAYVGAAIEQRDLQRKTLATFPVRNLFDSHMEFPTGDRSQPFGRAHLPDRPRIISLLIPVEEGAAFVALVAGTFVAAGDSPEKANGKKAIDKVVSRDDLFEIDVKDIKEAD